MGVVVWSDSLLEELRTVGDPHADEVITAYFGERSSSPHTLFRGLVHHEQLPDEQRSPVIEAYLREQPAWPEWADAEQVRRGQDFFVEWGLLIGMLHYCAALPSAYTMSRGVQVLHLTARLATDTSRRVHETAQMVINAMEPGGLEVGSRGYQDIRRVRLMHAAVRHLILHEPTVAESTDPSMTGPTWRDGWGTPINQEDMLATLMTFTQVVIVGLRTSGARFSDDDAASYFHAWSVAAHVLGIRPDLLPVTAQTAPDLWGAILRREAGASPEGQEMAAALVRLMRSNLPRWLHGVPPAQIRFLVGKEVGDMLAVERGGAVSVVFRPLSRALSVVALGEQHAAILRVLSRRIGRALLAGFVDAGREGSRGAFAIPTELAARWRMPAAGSGRP